MVLITDLNINNFYLHLSKNRLWISLYKHGHLTWKSQYFLSLPYNSVTCFYLCCLHMSGFFLIFTGVSVVGSFSFKQHRETPMPVNNLIYHFYSKIRYHLCFQRVIIFCWWGLVLWLHVGGCWRLGCLWQVLKIRWQWSLLPQLTSFHRWFLCSKMLFDSILPTELYRLESSLSNPARAVLLSVMF